MKKESLQGQIAELEKQVSRLLEPIDMVKLEEKASEYAQQMSDPAFWNIPERAQEISQLAANVEKQKANIEQLQSLPSLKELLSEADESDLPELQNEVKSIQKTAEAMRVQQLFSGEYDEKSAIITLSVGNGGQDAEDFCNMLLRMYLRWADMRGATAQLLESSESDVGLKSATLSIKMQNAYGLLQGEHGVHRLIRMSPFNAKGLRQTSFARVEILPDLGKSDAIEIAPSDIRIDVFRSSGAGGQSVNTTDSAVRITYLPLGLVVTCQNEKSQLQNKESAMRVLTARLAQLKSEQQASTLSEIKGTMLENSFGSQIKTYTLQPYKLVKDHRTEYEETQPDKVLSGEIDQFLETYLAWSATR